MPSALVAVAMRVKLLLISLSYFRWFWTDVVDFVAVKAPGINAEPQLSRAWPRRVQSKAVKITRFRQTSISREIWFGTRGSEVQILSPRPIKSITYRKVNPALWYWARCSSARRHIFIDCPLRIWMQRPVRNRLQSDGIVLVEL